MGGTYAEEVCLRARDQTRRSPPPRPRRRGDRPAPRPWGGLRPRRGVPAIGCRDGERIVDVVPAPLAVYDGLERRGVRKLQRGPRRVFLPPRRRMRRRRSRRPPWEAEAEMQMGRSRSSGSGSRSWPVSARRSTRGTASAEAVSPGYRRASLIGFTYSEILAKIKTWPPHSGEDPLLDYQGSSASVFDDPGDGGVGGGGTVGEVGRKGEARCRSGAERKPHRPPERPEVLRPGEGAG